MHMIIEVALLAISTLFGLVLFAKSLAPGRSFLALFAWIPVWIGTYLLWQPITGHAANGSYLSWWFILLLIVGVVVQIIGSSRGVLNVVRVIGAILLAVSLLNVDWGDPWMHHGDDKSTTSSGATPSPTVSPTAVPGLSEKDTQALGEQITNIYQGYKPGEVKVGAGQVPDSKAERGPTSFTKETIETREDLVKFFASDHKKAKQARTRVEQALRKAGYGDDEVKIALTSGDRWIWVAPTVESQVYGTTYSMNHGVVKVNGPRQVAPNDAIWFYVTRDAKIVAGAAVRADCGNPEVDKVRPVRPDTPPAPPIEETPKCPNGKPFNPDGTCPKDPSQDVNVNPAVPDSVKGPGTTPVGTDPGPAGTTYDTPTGCNGPCPRPSSDPSPSPVATVRPSGDPNGGSGNGGATPGPGPTDDRDSGQTTSPAPSASSGPVCGTGNPDDC